MTHTFNKRFGENVSVNLAVFCMMYRIRCILLYRSVTKLKIQCGSKLSSRDFYYYYISITLLLLHINLLHYIILGHLFHRYDRK